MNKTKFKAFLCYGAEDRGFVDDLYFELSKRWENIWYDKVCIMPGDSLHDLIEDGLAESQFFCIVLSSQIIRKNWVKKELKAALALEDERSTEEFRIVPMHACHLFLS